jgi:hypothetical protein
MTTCPNGHPNPSGLQLCQECDAFLVPASKTAAPWYHRWWRLAIAGAIVAILVSAVVIAHAVQYGGSGPPPAPPTGEAAVQQWWTGARQHVTDLQDAVDNAQQSMGRLDKVGLQRACQQIHDSAVVGLQAHLPAPDPDLSAELAAAIADAHTTSHMCLSAMAGSANNYDVEFMTYLDQVAKHLKAAVDIVNKAHVQA